MCGLQTYFRADADMRIYLYK